MFPKSLIDGHNRFRSGRLEHERERYQELAESGQRPEVMIIGCCDSRAGPETIFDSSPGEIFVVPRGVQHCPCAEEEAHLLLIEPRGTPNTGDTATAAPRREI